MFVSNDGISLKNINKIVDTDWALALARFLVLVEHTTHHNHKLSCGNCTCGVTAILSPC